MQSVDPTIMGAAAEHELLRVLCREALVNAAVAATGDVPARVGLLGQLQMLVDAARANIDRENLALRSGEAVVDRWGPHAATHGRGDPAATTAEFETTIAIDGAALASITRQFVREIVLTLGWEGQDVFGADLLRDDVCSLE